jgi:hypothetical protein
MFQALRPVLGWHLKIGCDHFNIPLLSSLAISAAIYTVL